MSALLLLDMARSFDASAVAATAQAECAERGAKTSGLPSDVVAHRWSHANNLRAAAAHCTNQAEACRAGAAALEREAAR